MGNSKVREGDYISVQSFMVKDLKLSGNELLVYAIIHGFSKDGESEFSGSLQYLQDWTNSSKRCIQYTLEKLVENGHIKRNTIEVNNVRFNHYSAIVPDCTPDAKIAPPSAENAPHNIEDNLDNKETNNNIIISKERKPRYYDNQQLDALFIDFLDMRKRMKVVNTDRAISMLIAKLQPFDDAVKIEILNKSILNGWKSVYPESVLRDQAKVDGQNVGKNGILLDGRKTDILDDIL